MTGLSLCRLETRRCRAQTGWRIDAHSPHGREEPNQNGRDRISDCDSSAKSTLPLDAVEKSTVCEQTQQELQSYADTPLAQLCTKHSEASVSLRIECVELDQQAPLEETLKAHTAVPNGKSGLRTSRRRFSSEACRLQSVWSPGDTRCSMYIVHATLL